MMLTPKASTRRPAPASLAKPSHSVGSSPIAPARTAGESVLDVDMGGPPVESGRRRRTAARGGQQQQAREADRGGAEAGREQRCPRAEGAHDEAAAGERTELGALRAPLYPANARPRRASGTRSWMSVRRRTFLTPWATPPTAKPSSATARTGATAAPAMPRPCATIAPRQPRPPAVATRWAT